MNEKSSGSRSIKQRLTAVGTRCADHVTPLYPQKLVLTSPTGGGRSVGIVRVRTKATEFFFLIFHNNSNCIYELYICACEWMDLREVGCGYMNWIGLAQDREGGGGL